MTEAQRAKLREAIAFLRTVPPEEFDPSEPCHSLVGWLPEVFPDEVGVNDSCRPYLMEDPDVELMPEAIFSAVFGVDQYHAFSLIGGTHREAVHPSLPALSKKPTPNAFADMLELFIEIEQRGEVLPIFKP